jgi:hypothetical protein
VSRPATGRFGPVFLAQQPGEPLVVVRTFALSLTDLQANRLLAALQTLCGRPLDHPRIARPIECGIQRGRPYLVHTYLKGMSLAEPAAQGGPLPLGEIVERLTFVAGALDFAEAAGVLHGALSSRDVIFSANNAGVSGLGLVQALESAGIEGFHAHRADDVAAFAAIARELLGKQMKPAMAAVLDGPLPGTALAVAGALQESLHVRSSAAPPVRAPLSMPAAPAPPMSIAPATPPTTQLDLLDIPLRDMHAPDRFVDEAPVVDLQTADRFVDEPPVVDVRTPNRFVDDTPSVNMRPMFGMSADADAAAPLSTTPGAVAGQSRGSTLGWLITGAVALALGVFAAFAGGFVVTRDTKAPAPVVTAPGSTPPPEATNGRAFTDAAVDEPKPAEPAPSTEPSAAAVAPSASRASRKPVPPARGSASTRAPTRVAPAEAPSGPAAMKVESLPAGAQVFVDGRSVGYAPLVVGELTPGTHSIRMQLPGYRPWVSAVTLGPGARERVAASLEQ